MCEPSPDSVRLLLVEDNPIDARVARRALMDLSVSYVLDTAEDGDAAIAYLAAPSRVMPDLVLLDLNLPGRDGFDVLRWVRNESGIRRVPIIVLTTSSSDVDINHAYDLGANAFINKPVDLESWKEAVAAIEAFWFSLARLPTP